MVEIARSKGEARRLGLDTYKTLRPCKKGHNAPRWTISKQCVECQPMPRTKQAVSEMRGAYNHALNLTIQSGILFVPIPKDDGSWWAVPVRDADSLDDRTQADPVKYDGD